MGAYRLQKRGGSGCASGSSPGGDDDLRRLGGPWLQSVRSSWCRRAAVALRPAPSDDGGRDAGDGRAGREAPWRRGPESNPGRVRWHGRGGGGQTRGVGGHHPPRRAAKAAAGTAEAVARHLSYLRLDGRARRNCPGSCRPARRPGSPGLPPGAWGGRVWWRLWVGTATHERKRPVSQVGSTGCKISKSPELPLPPSTLSLTSGGGVT